MIKIAPNRYIPKWFDVIDSDGFMVGTWKTPREARHKARMWFMYMTTGDELYLRKEQ